MSARSNKECCWNASRECQGVQRWHKVCLGRQAQSQTNAISGSARRHCQTRRRAQQRSWWQGAQSLACHMGKSKRCSDASIAGERGLSCVQCVLGQRGSAPIRHEVGADARCTVRQGRQHGRSDQAQEVLVARTDKTSEDAGSVAQSIAVEPLWSAGWEEAAGRDCRKAGGAQIRARTKRCVSKEPGRQTLRRQPILQSRWGPAL